MLFACLTLLSRNLMSLFKRFFFPYLNCVFLYSFLDTALVCEFLIADQIFPIFYRLLFFCGICLLRFCCHRALNFVSYPCFDVVMMYLKHKSSHRLGFSLFPCTKSRSFIDVTKSSINEALKLIFCLAAFVVTGF